jgi:formamidopyrimidine-DNA glycosylase
VIAGIGNIYSDEILFQARIHPQTPAELTIYAKRDLFSCITQVLKKRADAKAGARDSSTSFRKRFLFLIGKRPRVVRVAVGK